jgi:O-acetyl-ADP-ribose deacetylase (regulator of RNase III)
MVRATVERALTMARELGAKTIAMPALATGYGHLSIEQFAEGLAGAMQKDWSSIKRLTIVVRKPEAAIAIQRSLNRPRQDDRRPTK